MLVRAILLGCILHAVTAVVFVGNISPKSYDLKFLIDVNSSSKFYYYGVVDIVITASKPTQKINLNCLGLIIQRKDISISGNIGIQNIVSDTSNEIITLDLIRGLVVNQEYTITIPFIGALQGTRGVYIGSVSSNKTDLHQPVQDNNEKWLIMTDFKRNEARRLFPCFDEPKFKATFNVTIGHHENYHVRSNMPRREVTNDNPMEKYWPWSAVAKIIQSNRADFEWDIFEASPAMPTFAFGFVISKLKQYVSAGSKSTKVWTRLEIINQAQFASEVAPSIQRNIESFLSVTFPLPKIDHMAVPDHISSNGAKSWGLITYKEEHILGDYNQLAMSDKVSISMTIAHAISHMWIGNLVTMESWQEQWLVKGFANFLMGLGAVAGMKDSVAEPLAHVLRTSFVLDADASDSSVAMSASIQEPEQSFMPLDIMSYHKSAAIIRMICLALDEKIFRKGLSNFLNMYAYKTTDQYALWQALAAVGTLTRNVSVRHVVDSWTTQPGYPLLTVTRNYQRNTVSVSQKRYLSSGQEPKSQSSWWVPLVVRSAGDAVNAALQVQWLARDEGVATPHQFQVDVPGDQWLLFNANMIAPCRVNYEKRNWRLVTAALAARAGAVPLLSRVQLLSDAFELAWSGILDYGIALQLARSLKKEDNFLPLMVGLESLWRIGALLQADQDYEVFQEFVRDLILDNYKAGGIAHKTIFMNNNMNMVYIQTLSSKWACMMDVDDCRTKAVQMFDSLMKVHNPDVNNPIPGSLRETVYCAGVRHGGAAQWQLARRLVPAAPARAALACAREPWLLHKTLDLALQEDSGLSAEHRITLISEVAATPVGFPLAKNFIYNRSIEIFRSFNSTEGGVGILFEKFSSLFTNEADLDEFVSWREKHTSQLAAGDSAVERGLRRARDNIAWVRDHRRSLIYNITEINTAALSERKSERDDRIKTRKRFDKLRFRRMRSKATKLLMSHAICIWLWGLIICL